VSDPEQSDATPAEPVPSELSAADKTAAGEGIPVSSEAGVPRSKGPRWRRILAWVLLVIGLILVPVAVTGDWVRANIFSTQGFVDTVGPLGADPAIQDQVATTLTNQIFNAIDVEQRIQNALPDGLGVIAGPIADRLQARTLQGAMALTHTTEFADLWTNSMTRVHTALVGFFDGTGKAYLGPDGTIVIDMSGLSSRVVDRLQAAGITISPEERPVLASGQVPVAQVAALEKVKGLLNFVNKMFIVMPILAVLFLAGSVAIAIRRQRAAVRVGIGLMIAMAIFLILIGVGRSVYTDATTGAGMSDAASASIWDALTIALRATAWALFAVGVLLFIHPYVVRALRGQTMEHAAGGAAARGWDTGPVGRFFARYRIWLALGVLLIGFLVLVAIGGTPVWRIILIAVIVVVVDALIFFIARLSELAAKERDKIIDESA
jgi:hypothetical protein